MRHQHQQKSPQHESNQPPLLSGTATNSSCSRAVVVETLEHRRLAEFCDACKRYRYIGLCYGQPGVGKTLSARHYANWGNVQSYWNRQCQTKALLKKISKGTVAFYTSPVVITSAHNERDILWHTGSRRPMLPRLLRLHPSTHQRLIRLSKEAERDGAYRVAKRLRTVVLNAEGHTSGELAKILQAPRSKVSEWLQRYQSHGVDGLLEGYRSGRPAGGHSDSGQRLLP